MDGMIVHCKVQVTTVPGHHFVCWFTFWLTGILDGVNFIVLTITSNCSNALTKKLLHLHMSTCT